MQGLDFLYFLYVEFLEVQTWSLTLFHPLISARKEAAIKNTQVADSNLQDYKTENPAGNIYIYSELCSNEKPRDSNAYITHTHTHTHTCFQSINFCTRAGQKKMGGRVAPASKEQDRRSSAGTMRETDRKRKTQME